MLTGKICILHKFTIECLCQTYSALCIIRTMEPACRFRHSMTRNDSSKQIGNGGIILDRRNDMQTHGEGRLPAMAPLANPYVPFQLENPPVYEARKGIIRGTLFPGLDLPFMGMVNQKDLPQTPLAELQTLAFAINELPDQFPHPPAFSHGNGPGCTAPSPGSG